MFNLNPAVSVVSVNQVQSLLVKETESYTARLGVMGTGLLQIHADKLWELQLTQVSDLMRNVIMSYMDDETVSDKMVVEAIRDTYVPKQGELVSMTLAGSATPKARRCADIAAKLLYKGRKLVVVLALADVMADAVEVSNLKIEDGHYNLSQFYTDVKNQYESLLA